MSEQAIKTLPHTHIRAVMKDKWLKNTKYEHKWVDKARTPEEFYNALMLDLGSTFEIRAYTKEYGYYKDGNTEYIKINYHFNDTEDRLTVHVFSCYCEDFVEGDQPPF